MTYPSQPVRPPAAPRRRKWPWVLGALGVAFLAIVIAVANSTHGTISQASAGAGDRSAAASPSHTATWGQRYAWPDGIAVEVAAPVAFHPSEAAAAAAASSGTIQRAVEFTITVVNGTHANYAFNTMIMDRSVQFNSADANAITDLDQQIGTSFESTVLPGQSYTYKLAYAVTPAPGTVQMEFTESVGGDTAIFTGKA